MSIEWRCILCGSKPQVPCINTIQLGEPLPGRDEHIARKLPPNPKEAK